MNNNEFLKEFEFFKKHPKKAEKYDKDTPICLAAVSFLGFLVLVPFLSVEWLTGYVLSAIMLFVFSAFFIEFKNNRIVQFENVLYTGDLKTLFGDLESPDAKDCLEDIKTEMKNYLGIRGSTAIHISNRINSPYLKAVRLKKEEVNKQIEEINKIQNKT